MSRLFLVGLFVFLLFLPGVFGSGLPFAVRPLVGSGDVSPDSEFSYVFNFTSGGDCSGVLLSVGNDTVTDAQGVGSVWLNLSGLLSPPSFFCEYRNEELRKVHSVPDVLGDDFFVAGNVYGEPLFFNNVSFGGFLDVNGSVNASCFDASGDNGLSFLNLQPVWVFKYADGLGSDDTGIVFNTSDSSVDYRALGLNYFRMLVAGQKFVVGNGLVGGFSGLDFNVSGGSDGFLYDGKSINWSSDLSVLGNFTGNNIYAGMWNYSDSGWSFGIGESGVYYNMSNLVVTHTNGMNFSTSPYPNLGIVFDGVYKVDWSASFSGGANNEYGFGIAKNWDIANSRNCYNRRTSGSVGIGNVGGSCLLDLVVGDTLNFILDDEADPSSDVTVYSVNIVVLRVGG